MNLPGFSDDRIWPSRIAEHIFRRFELRPRIGIEREFYVTGDCRDRFLLPAREVLKQASPLLYAVSTEDGPGQFEYALRETADMDALTRAADASNQAIEGLTESIGGGVLWDARPFVDEPASGLHVHITLHDHAGTNHLAKLETDGPESSVMLACVAGLLSTMRPLMLAFAPSERCYARICPKPYPAVMFSPISVSWGTDNRSVALRLPGSAAEPARRRIEHRVSSACADLETVLVAILAGVCAGLAAGKAPDLPKTRGLANHPAATEPRLPSSRDAAQRWLASDGAPFLARLADELAHENLRGESGHGAIRSESPS